MTKNGNQILILLLNFMTQTQKKVIDSQEMTLDALLQSLMKISQEPLDLKTLKLQFTKTLKKLKLL